MFEEFAKEYLHSDLRDARATMLWKLEGLAEYDVRRPLTPTGTNLLGLIKHLTITEAWYFGEVFGRPFPERLPWRDDEADERADDAKLAALFDHKLQLADMWATEHESRAEIVDRYRRIWTHSDATIAALDIDAPGRVAWWPRPNVKLFNIMVHVLNETNRHAGHADILREQIDGAVGTEAGSTARHGRDATFWEHHRAKIERAAESQVGASARAVEWDARYREREGAMWSGRPNGRLVSEVADLAPGRALDVGCGEGADAIWLARRGWTVTGIDISDVAVRRAREAAELAGVMVEWVSGDALQTPFPAHSFDLVSLQYPALPKAAGEAAVRTLLDAVRPNGLFLAVYHDLDDEHREHMKSRGVDPADYVGVDDLGRLLGRDFTVELHAIEPRIDPPPDTLPIGDIVWRVRRR